MKVDAAFRWQCIRWMGRAVFGVLFLGLLYLQVLRGGHYKHLAQRNAFRLMPIEAPRGDIVDRHGHVLATNRLSFDVAIVPQDAPALEFLLTHIAELTHCPVSALRRAYMTHASLPFVPATIMTDAPFSLITIIEEHRHELPGVVVLPRPKRDYPYGALAAHVLGYLGPIDAQELERRRGYGFHVYDWVGKSGVEAAYDAYLRGEDGGQLVEVDHRGRQVRIVSRRDPVPGQRVTLTLDAELQQVAEEGLKDHPGACVVLAPQSGEVLVMASSPAFEPAGFLLSSRASVVTWLQDPRQPLLNRAMLGAYPPGSIFKVVTSLAALEEHKITPVTTFTCGGSYTIGSRTFHCWKHDGHGLEFLRQGLTHSCNIYFFQVGLAVGADALVQWAHRLGLGEPSGIDLPGEQRGFIPTRSWKQRVLHEAWYDGDTANMAIGQGSVLLTPLQAARMIAAVANGGWLVKPQLVRGIGDVALPVPSVHSVGVSPAARQAVLEGLIDVVASPEGTGHRAWKPGVALAGKTGTAQTRRPGISHAWMIGLTPVQQPAAAFAVLFEYGGSGGLLPALLAQRIAEVLELRRHAP